AHLDNPGGGEQKLRWQAAYEFRQAPVGANVDLLVEYYSPRHYLQSNENGTTLSFLVRAPRAELPLWVMLPTGKRHSGRGIVRYPDGKPQDVETVRVVTEYRATDYTILAFKLLSLKAHYQYEVQWFYK